MIRAARLLVTVRSLSTQVLPVSNDLALLTAMAMLARDAFSIGWTSIIA